MFRFWQNFDERPVTWIDDWENRQPGEPEAGGWYRYVPRSTFDDPWVDACRSMILLDTFGWPAVCRLHLRSEYIAPSIDLSVGFHRAQPAEPWLYAQATAPSAHAGLIGCEGRVLGAHRRAPRGRRPTAPLPPRPPPLVRVLIRLRLGHTQCGSRTHRSGGPG